MAMLQSQVWHSREETTLVGDFHMDITRGATPCSGPYAPRSAAPPPHTKGA